MKNHVARKALSTLAAMRIAIKAQPDPRTAQGVYLGKTAKRAPGTLRAAGFLATLLWLGCASQGTGGRTVPQDAAPDVGADLGAPYVESADVAPALDLGAGLEALPPAEVSPDARSAGPEAGPEVQATALDAGPAFDWDAVTFAEVGPDARDATGTDGPPPLPDTCTASKVYMNLCNLGAVSHYWPGTRIPCGLCQMINAPYPPPSLFTDPLLACNSFAVSQSDPTSGHAVVCLPADYFCDIYCPAPHGG